MQTLALGKALLSFGFKDVTVLAFTSLLEQLLSETENIIHIRFKA